MLTDLKEKWRLMRREVALAEARRMVAELVERDKAKGIERTSEDRAETEERYALFLESETR